MINQQDLNSYKSQLHDQMAIRTFVDKLIEERKDPEVTPATLPAVRTLLIKEVNKAVNEHFISLLSDTEVQELDKLLEAHVSDEELNTFFRSKMDNVSVEIATALLSFRAAYLYPVWKKQQEELTAKQAAQKSTQTDVSAVISSSPSEPNHLPPAPVM